jgi:hypothetical protein
MLLHAACCTEWRLQPMAATAAPGLGLAAVSVHPRAATWYWPPAMNTTRRAPWAGGHCYTVAP